MVLVAAVSAVLSYAIIEGPTRGWSSRVVLAAFMVAAVLTPLLLWRSATAARPVIDLSPFRDRQFSLMNLAILLFTVSFYGTLLSNVIFLQQLGILGAADRPGRRSRSAARGAHRPLDQPSGGADRIPARSSPRRRDLDGRIRPSRGRSRRLAPLAAHWLPPVLLTGAGIGLTLPVQAGAAVASLPDH
ncbi:hypothetical protein OHB06_52030 [Streptomyces sp. NBC_01604]|uniref:hypothetical protein n=1 Tax=Streptomyces sp. NBC_01604 TaxID=2975894 RepID=UPI00386E5BAC